MRRITAVRCIVRFPDVFRFLEANEINLGTISRVAKILTAQNCSIILERIRKKSLREVEAIAAEYDVAVAFPGDRVRTVVARVPVTAQLGHNHLRYDGEKSSSVGESTANRPSEDSPATGAGQGGLQLERRKRVEFTAHDELMAKLDRIRSLASHRLPANATLEQLIDFMADYVIGREDPVKRHERREKRKAAASAEQGPACASHDPRHVPAGVRDQVFVRDTGRCTFVGANGQRCGSARHVQIDHVEPVARGGSATIDNLRLLCAQHNRLEAERIMGRKGVPGT
jgi:5-methylcytosine-specific restriction endonuclease McrA